MKKKKRKIVHTDSDNDSVDSNILNIKCISVWCLYFLNNTQTRFEAQFMEKLSNTERELKDKALLIKKCV